MNFIYFLLIGLAAGWLAGVLTKGSGMGWLGNLVVGVIGSILGGFLFGLAGFSQNSLLAELIVATVGAIVLLYLVAFVRKQQSKK